MASDVVSLGSTDPAAAELRPVLAARFAVSVDGVALGWFQEVSGLGFDIAVETIDEGGQNYGAHKVPGPITWHNITLRNGWVRTSLLLAWALGTSDAAGGGWSAGMPTCELGVTLLDEAGASVQKWVFERAFPVGWKGPSLAAAGDDVATEYVEVAHHGLAPA